MSKNTLGGRKRGREREKRVLSSLRLPVPSFASLGLAWVLRKFGVLCGLAASNLLPFHNSFSLPSTEASAGGWSQISLTLTWPSLCSIWGSALIVCFDRLCLLYNSRDSATPPSAKQPEREPFQMVCWECYTQSVQLCNEPYLLGTQYRQPRGFSTETSQ